MTSVSQTLPKRSAKFGVGKEIGGAVYLHRSYEHKLGNVLVAAKTKLPDAFDYQVVKYNFRSEAVSFIQCAEFDTMPEPIVGEIATVDVDGNIRKRQQSHDPEIYHHKWLFVADDYGGFDVEQSMRRSLAWMSLDGVDRKRIGRKSHWDVHVAPRIKNSNG